LEKNIVVGALRQSSPMLSVASFRTWLTSRPEEEHWELIEGVPMMVNPRNRRHQRIASNLEPLLNAALRRRDPTFVAYHDIRIARRSLRSIGPRTAGAHRSCMPMTSSPRRISV